MDFRDWKRSKAGKISHEAHGVHRELFVVVELVETTRKQVDFYPQIGKISADFVQAKQKEKNFSSLFRFSCFAPLALAIGVARSVRLWLNFCIALPPPQTNGAIAEPRKARRRSRNAQKFF